MRASAGREGDWRLGASAALPVQPSLEGVPAVPDYPPLCLQTKSGVEPLGLEAWDAHTRNPHACGAVPSARR